MITLEEKKKEIALSAKTYAIQVKKRKLNSERALDLLYEDCVEVNAFPIDPKDVDLLFEHAFKHFDHWLYYRV